MRLDEINRVNERALQARPWLQPDYAFRPISAHDPTLHRLKREHPFFGYVEVGVTGVRPFVMMSNNDDVVAQVYFWFGPDAYESLSLRVWRRLCRSSELVLDVGAYTGLFTLVAAFASPDAELHAFEPDPAVHARLVMNLAVNRLGRRVHLHELAAADVAGSATLHAFQGVLSLTTGSSLTVKEGKAVDRRRQVEVVRLDEVIPRDGRRLAIKIDAEEAEDRVLAGLRDALGQRETSLLIEVSSRAMLERCREQLRNHTFAVIDDVRHTAMIDDPSLLDARDRNRERPDQASRRIDPPNVVFSQGGRQDLEHWLEPLVDEPGLGRA